MASVQDHRARSFGKYQRKMLCILDDVCLTYHSHNIDKQKVRSLARRSKKYVQLLLSLANSEIPLYCLLLPDMIESKYEMQLVELSSEDVLEKSRKEIKLTKQFHKRLLLVTEQCRLPPRTRLAHKNGTSQASIIFDSREECMSIVHQISLTVGPIWRMTNKFKAKWTSISDFPCLLLQVRFQERIVEIKLTTYEILQTANLVCPFAEAFRSLSVPSIMCPVCHTSARNALALIPPNENTSEFSPSKDEYLDDNNSSDDDLSVRDRLAAEQQKGKRRMRDVLEGLYKLVKTDAPNKHRQALSLVKQGHKCVQNLVSANCYEIDIYYPILRKLRSYSIGQKEPQPALDRSPAHLVDIARTAQVPFALCLQNILGRSAFPLSRLWVGPVRTLDKLKEKLYKKKEGMCFDVNRATIICQTSQEFLDIAKAISMHFAIVSLKNKFRFMWSKISEPPCLRFHVGFRHESIEHVLEPSKAWIVEIQVTTWEIFQTKSISHPFYELVRSEVTAKTCRKLEEHKYTFENNQKHQICRAFENASEFLEYKGERKVPYDARGIVPETKDPACEALVDELQENLDLTKECSNMLADTLHSRIKSLQRAFQNAATEINEILSSKPKRQLSELVVQAETRIRNLDFQHRVLVAMNTRHEYNLKFALSQYEQTIEEKQTAQEAQPPEEQWYLGGKCMVEKIDKCRKKLNKALTAENHYALQQAIWAAQQGAGDSWPDGPLLFSDDPTLRRAVQALDVLQAVGRISEEEVAQLRTALKLLNGKEDPIKMTSKTSFRLAEIAAKWHAMVPLLDEPAVDREVVHGTHGALAAMLNLYQMDDPDWHKVRDSVYVGLIKETQNYGNTSLSMGVAKVYFSKYPQKTFVGCMNCGSGGVKYQLYCMQNDGKIVTLGEYKPAQRGKRDAATFKNLQIGTYAPKNPMTPDQLRETMLSETLQAPWKNAELVSKFFKEKVDIFAFVTGNLRNHHENLIYEYKKANDQGKLKGDEGTLREAKAKLKEAEDIHLAVSSVFRLDLGEVAARPISELLEINYPYKTTESYLIPHSEDARMEQLAITVLYKQLGADMARGQKMTPVITLGIGKASTQCTQSGYDNHLTYDKGISNPEIVYIGEKIAADYLADRPRLANLSGVIQECHKQSTLATIALKSGCLLALKDCLSLVYKLFVQSMYFIPLRKSSTISIRVQRNTNKNDKKCEVGTNVGLPSALEVCTKVVTVEVQLPSTVPEVCAEVALFLRKNNPTELHNQYVKLIDKESNKIVTTISNKLHKHIIQFYRPDEIEDGAFVSPTEAKSFDALADHFYCHFPDWRNTASNSIERSTLCIPLEWFPDKWLAVNDKLGNGKNSGENAKLLGVQAAFSAFKDLCYLEDPAWQKAHKKIQIVLLNSTFECGDASVGMGLATRFFADAQNKSHVVCMLTFASDGLKFQVYTNLRQLNWSAGRIALVAEFKPPQGKKLSFVELDVSDPAVQPPFTSTRPVSQAKFNRRLQKLLENVPWRFRSWPLGKVPMFAFVTGKLRDHWEDIKDNAKESLCTYVNTIFVTDAKSDIEVRPASDILKKKQENDRFHILKKEEGKDCFFISSQDECEMDLAAVSKMYSQLAPVKNIALDVIAVLGIGGSKSRFTFDSSSLSVGDRCISKLPGISKRNVLTLGSRLVKAMKGSHSKAFKAVIKALEAVDLTATCPVIVLKSSALELALQQEVRDFLMKEPPCYTLGLCNDIRISELADPSRLNVGLFIRNLDTIANSWEVPRLIQSDVVQAVSKVRISKSCPISLARLCAMAGLEYRDCNILLTRVVYEFPAQPPNNMLKLVELSDRVEAEFLSTNGCLHFFANEDLARDPSNKVKLIAAQRIQALPFDDLHSGQPWVRECFAQLVNGYQMPEILEKAHVDELELVLIVTKDRWMIAKSNGSCDTDADIDEAYKDLEDMLHRMRFRLKLMKATSAQPLNLDHINSLLKKLARTPKNERFPGDEIEIAKTLLTERRDNEYGASAALDAAMASKNLQEIRKVLESSMALLSPYHVAEAYRFRDKLMTAGSEIRRLLEAHDFESLDRLLCDEQDVSDPNVRLAMKFVENTRCVLDRIGKARLSKDVDALSRALDDAREYGVQDLVEVQRAESDYLNLQKILVTLKQVVEEGKFEAMRMPYVFALDAGVSGEEFEEVRAKFLEHARKNGNGNEQVIAIQEVAFGLVNAQRSYDLNRLRAWLEQAQSMGMADVSEWKAMHPGVAGLEAFTNCNTEYQKGEKLKLRLEALVNELGRFMRLGDVDGLRWTLAAVPSSATLSSEMCAIAEVEAAMAYVKQASGLQRRLAQAAAAKDIDKLEELFCKVRNEFLTEQGQNTLLTMALQKQYEYGLKIKKALMDLEKSLEDPQRKKLVEAVKQARDEDLVCGAFRKAWDVANKHVRSRLEHAFEESVEDLYDSEELHKELEEAIQQALSIVPKWELIGQAQLRQAIYLQAQILRSFYRKGDLESCVRSATLLEEGLTKFVRKLPSMVSLLKEVKKKWCTEKLAEEAELKRNIQSKQVDPLGRADAWSKKIVESRRIGDLEVLRQCLLEYPLQKSDAKSEALNWAKQTLADRLHKRAFKVRKDLQSQSNVDQHWATGLLTNLKAAIESVQKWTNQEPELKTELQESLHDAEAVVAAFTFRKFVKEAMSTTNENALRLHLADYNKQLHNIDLTNQDWFQEAQNQIAKIDRIRKKLCEATSLELKAAIADAQDGTGDFWPQAPPLQPKDDVLVQAIEIERQRVLAIRFTQMDSLRAVLKKWNVKVADAYSQKRYFKLAEIVVKWHAVAHLLDDEEDTDVVEITRGAHSALATLCALWHMNSPKWRKVRDKIYVGLVKESKDYGNTSVSMGLAKKYFDKFKHKNFVGFMNSGRGGVKYQLYARGESGIVFCLGEYKPGQKGIGRAASFADLKCGEYRGTTSAQELKQMILDELAGAPWRDADLKSNYFVEEPELFGFITGKLRNHVAELLEQPGSEKNLDEIHSAVKEVFGWPGPSQLAKPVSLLVEGPDFEDRMSFFISQKNEANMEHLATQLLYAQMSKFLPKGPENQEMESVASFGIGLDASQFTQDGFQVPLPIGMKDPDVIYFGETLVNHYLKNEHCLDSLISSVEDCVGRDILPVIAIKSGCLLIPSKKHHPGYSMFMQALEKEPSSTISSEISVIAQCYDTPEIKIFVKLSFTISELCAYAAAVFFEKDGKHRQFLTVCDAKGDVLTSISSSLFDQTLYFFDQHYKAKISPPPKTLTNITFDEIVEHVRDYWPAWQNTAPKHKSLTPSIPLDWILDKWHLVSHLLRRGQSQEQEDIIRSTQATLSMLKDLALRGANGCSDLLKLRVGLVKSTFECGNTSVAMGLAGKFFDSKNKDQVVCFLNFGSGGLKIQVYTNLPQENAFTCVALLAELKIGKFNFAQLIDDLSSTASTPRVTKFQESLRKRINRVPWRYKVWPVPIVHTFAFVTGPLRDHHEVLQSTLKMSIEQGLNKIFEYVNSGNSFSIKPVSEILNSKTSLQTYFITSQEEAAMEMIAFQVMYSQISAGRLNPVAGLKIDRVKSRFVIATEKESIYSSNDNLPGMGNGVLMLGPSLMKSLNERELVSMIQAALNQKQEPVLALKGVALAMISADVAQRDSLIKEPLFSKISNVQSEQFILNLAQLDQRRLHILQFIRQLDDMSHFKWKVPFHVPRLPPSAFSSSFVSLSVPLPVTLSRLCALAALAYKNPTLNYFRVFLDQGASEDEIVLVELKQPLYPELFASIKGQACLYFFTEQELVDRDRSPGMSVASPVFNSDHMWDAVAEFLVRAQSIFVIEEEMLQQAVIAHFGLTPDHIQELAHYLKAVPDEVIRVFEKFSNAYTAQANPPPCGPLGVLSPHSAVESYMQKLPLGIYKGEAKSFYDAVAQQLQFLDKDSIPNSYTASDVQAAIEQELRHQPALMGLDASYQRECEALTNLYFHVAIHVVYPNNCKIVEFALDRSQHMWLFHGSFWAPLWSPPIPSLEPPPPLLQLIGPLLDEPSFSNLRIFAQEWKRISADQFLLDEVKSTMVGLVYQLFEQIVQECASTPVLLVSRWQSYIEDALSFSEAELYSNMICRSFARPLILYFPKIADWASVRLNMEWGKAMKELFDLLRDNMELNQYTTTFAADEAYLVNIPALRYGAVFAVGTSSNSQPPPPPAPPNRLKEDTLIEALKYNLPSNLYLGDWTSLYDALAQQLQALRVLPVNQQQTHDEKSLASDISFFWKQSFMLISNCSNDSSSSSSSRSRDGSKQVIDGWRDSCVAIAHTYPITLHVLHHAKFGRKELFSESFGSGQRYLWVFRQKSSGWAALWSAPLSYEASTLSECGDTTWPQILAQEDKQVQAEETGLVSSPKAQTDSDSAISWVSERDDYDFNSKENIFPQDMSQLSLFPQAAVYKDSSKNSDISSDDDEAWLSAAQVGDIETLRCCYNKKRQNDSIVKGQETITFKRDRNGATAFLLTASNGHLEAMKWLSVEGGATMTEQNYYGATALLLAASNGHLNIVQWLLTEGGATMTEQNSYGASAFLLAASNGHLDVVQWLLAKGGAKEISCDSRGATALLLAASNGHLDAVQWLLAKGDAKVTERNHAGATALLLAASNGHLDIVQWLLAEGGAKVTERNHAGVTALSLAASNRPLMEWVLVYELCIFYEHWNDKQMSLSARWSELLKLEHSLFSLKTKVLFQPVPFPSHTSLVVLDVSRMKLTKLPDLVDVCLRILNVSHNSLTQLPESWIDPGCLWLDASFNCLEMLPASLCRANCLICLDVSDNRLKCLPPEFGPSTLLRVQASRNMLQRLPMSVGNCAKLQVLSLENNSDLMVLPSSLRHLTRLRVLNVQGCPVSRLVSHLAKDSGTQELLKGMLATFDEQTNQQAVFRAPVVLCGESRAGKTSLSYQLILDSGLMEIWSILDGWVTVKGTLRDGKLTLVEFPSQKPLESLSLSDYYMTEITKSHEVVLEKRLWLSRKTLRFAAGTFWKWCEVLAVACQNVPNEGIRVHNEEWLIEHKELLELGLPLQSKLGANVPDPLYLTLWDFPGEQEHLGIHQLFFPNQAVYVAVWDMSEPDGFDKLCKWLLKAKYFSNKRRGASRSLYGVGINQPQNVLVIVGTHLDTAPQSKGSARKDMVRQRLAALDLGWSLEAIEEVVLGHGVDINTVKAVREAVVRAATKLECMGEFVDESSLSQIHEKLLNMNAKVVKRTDLKSSLEGKVQEEDLESSLIRLCNWGKCVYFPPSEIIINDPNWLTQQVIGRLLRVATDCVIQHALWPAGSLIGVITDVQQLKTIWSADMFSILKPDELMGLLSQYGICVRLFGDAHGLESSFLLPFLIPLAMIIPPSIQMSLQRVLTSPLPTVSRRFEFGSYNRALALNWAELSARIVARLVSKPMEEVVVCRDKFMIAWGDAYVYCELAPTFVQIAITSTLATHNVSRFRALLELGCSVMRQELNETGYDFSERVMCPFCLREKRETPEWWAYCVKTKRLECTTLRCAHRRDDHTCLLREAECKTDGCSHAQRMPKCGLQQEVFHHELYPLPLWLLLGEAPSENVDLGQLQDEWSSASSAKTSSPAGSELVPVDAYSACRARVRDIEKKICNHVHQTADVAQLKKLSEECTILLQQWFRLELDAAKGFRLLRDVSNFSDVDSISQGLVDKSIQGLIRAAHAAQPYFESALKALSEEGKVQVFLGPVKRQSRVQEKMVEVSYQGKHALSIFNMNRGTILCSDEGKFVAVMLLLPKYFGKQLKLKNKFNRELTTPSELPSLHVQLTLRNEFEWMEPGKFWGVELQITTPEFWEISKHSYYFYEILKMQQLPENCVFCGKQIVTKKL